MGRGGGGIAPRVALVMGHPGHELAVYGWTARLNPCVHIMTDGGGSLGRARLSRTDNLLEELGARRSDALHPVPDTVFYDWIRHRDVAAFRELVDGLAGSFLADGIDIVLVDAAEGFNPTHDICHAIALAASRIAARDKAQPILCLEYELAAPLLPGIERGAPGPDIVLSESQFAAKVAAAVAYSELDGDIRELISVCGLDAFRRESLHVAREPGVRYRARPHFEVIGEERVRQGIYRDVVRYAEHVRPVLDMLRGYAGREKVPALRARA